MKHTPLEILFEDPFLCIINKVSGIHSVAQNKIESENSIARMLIQKDASYELVAPKALDAGLVNRLDFETSGIVIAAKKREVWEKLFEDLKAGKLNKSYLAILDGNLEQREKVETWIYSRHRGSKKVSQKHILDERPDRALPAESLFFPINFNKWKNLTLASITAHSARRHQVRAHAAWLGAPLCGDQLYGSNRSLKEVLKQASAPNFALHAYKLEFSHPETDEKISITAPYDAGIYEQSFSID